MKTDMNPWIDRFCTINNVQAIKEKTRLRVQPLLELKSMMSSEAADRIEDAWKGTFYPTERDCQIMLKVVQAAASHSARHHPDHKTHLARSYRETIDIEPYMPMLLLGPAGTGKSELGKALLRLFPEPTSIEIDSSHGNISLAAIRSVKAQGHNGVASIIHQLAPNSTEKVVLARLYEICARYQYICGTSCILVDELQFFTQSKDANALITQLMLGISYIKVPYLVIANYSLAHRLMRRNSEDLQRLVGRPILLLPDGPETHDWLAVLDEYQLVVPGVFNFQFSKHASDLWSFCVGLKRVLVVLLVLAYRQVRDFGRFQVNFSDVEFAYTSLEFSGYKVDVEKILLHGMTSPALKEDLRCPCPIDPSVTERFNEALRAARDSKVAEAALHASINVTERKAVSFIKKIMSGCNSDESIDAPLTQKKPKRAKFDSKTMKEAGERFRKSF
jgi:energy-coupling factor transporter ATP-binding protein EcfA2